MPHSLVDQQFERLPSLLIGFIAHVIVSVIGFGPRPQSPSLVLGRGMYCAALELSAGF